MAQHGLSNVAIAKRLGLEPGVVSHWVTGRRPVPIKYVVELGRLIDMEPAEINPSYADIIASAVPDPDRRRALPTDQALARVERRIESVLVMLGALATTMTEFRPVEAATVAKLIRHHSHAKMIDRLSISKLLEVLDGGDGDRPAASNRVHRRG